MPAPKTRPSLIGRLGDPDCDGAWSEFVDSYSDLIRRVALQRGLQSVDADDVTQEVLAVVARRVTRFDVNADGSFRGWLIKIARDVTIDLLRRRSRNVAVGGSTANLQLANVAEDPVTLWDIESDRMRLRLACEKVRPCFQSHTWQSFWLTAIEEQSIAETAHQLNISEGSVRVARCRVLSKLRNAIEQT